ncbi:MAG: NAD(P)H-dependent oxidoreductase subunit E [Actinomycetota bacterium]|nr:NAD(P)H-dependent oxidoreductase subunit E [Actinomycetota bacterium]
MADLHLSDASPDDRERRVVNAVVGDPVVVVESERLVRGGGTRRRERRHLLLPALHALQAEKGWISPGGLNHVADRLQVPAAEAYGVATFYDMFSTDDPGVEAATCHVCVDPACAVAGAATLADDLRAEGKRVHEGPCLGQCERAPAVFIQGVGEPDRVPADDDGLVFHQTGDPALRLLRRFSQVDPSSLDSYRAHGGYEALTRAIALGSDEVINMVTASGLSGRGGAAFPTGVKWRAVADEQGRPKHVVANADESEPGTFKDRFVMEHDPFALVEALTVAGLTVDAEQGWIYIRGEYPLATLRLNDALQQARGAGLLGADVAGTGRRFDIELRRGAGAYICGEETALFNSIEGYRGEPRNKPPFPTTHGLFGEPTAINNPETLLNVLDVVTLGVDSYRSLGTEASPGTKLLCLSGHIARPGVYEVPFGTTLGQVLELAGGPVGTLQAVLMGGAAGSFVGPDQLDLPLTLEDTRAAGTTLGSGVVMVFNDGVDMLDMVTRLARFFRDESCGQCVPCRVGTVRQHEALLQIQRAGAVDRSRRALIDDIAQIMADASICGLGHTAASAVQSALSLGLIGESS